MALGPDARCALGSVKTNLGNLDAAAGATGLVKAVLAVRDGVIPANLHFDTPNPQIDFAGFEVPVKTTQWPVTGGPRRAGVSSFGLGGTNAHVVVEQPPQPQPRGAAPDRAVLPVSARTPEALRDAVRRLRDHLAGSGDLDGSGGCDGADGWFLADVAYTLAGRRAFEHRAAVVARSVPDAISALDHWLKGAFSRTIRLKAPFSQKSGPPPAPLGELAEAWLAGGDVDWSPLFAGGEHRRVWLPPYPFQRTRHWIEAP
jgi:acyl transferase domain-containing protein